MGCCTRQGAQVPTNKTCFSHAGTGEGNIDDPRCFGMAVMDKALALRKKI